MSDYVLPILNGHITMIKMSSKGEFRDQYGPLLWIISTPNHRNMARYRY